MRPEWLDTIMSWIPYIGMTTRRADTRGRPLLTRVLEGALPGIIVAGITIWTQNQVHQAEIENLQKMQTQTQEELQVLAAKVASSDSKLYDLNTRISILEGGQGSGGKVK